MLNPGLTPDSTGPVQGNAMKPRTLGHSLMMALAFGLAAPALAQQGPPPPPGMPPMGAVDANGNYYGADPRPEWHGDQQRIPAPQAAGYDRAAFEQARADWLAVCRRNHGNGDMVGRGRHHSGADAYGHDWCEAYLDRYTTWQTVPVAGTGTVSYGYAPMTVMVPVAYVQTQGKPHCETTVSTEEYVVEEPQRKYSRRIMRPRMPVPPRLAPVADKRVRIN